MKQIVLYLTSILFIPACTQKVQAPAQAEGVCISILRDRTDVHMIAPDERILSLYDFKQHPLQEVYFRLQDITDMQLSPVHTYHIPAGIEEDADTKRDPWHRERLIVSFYDSVRHILKPDNTPAVKELTQSFCFTKIIHELNFLSAHTGRKKILLIYSNLLENNDAFSCFVPEDKLLLQTKPEGVSTLLSKTFGTVPNLPGIDVYVLYQPQDKRTEENFLLMYGMYKIFLESKGARVFLGTNNEALQFN